MVVLLNNICTQFFIAFPPFSVWFFYCRSFFSFLFTFVFSVFWLLWVSSLPYPNLLRNKSLGCCNGEAKQYCTIPAGKTVPLFNKLVQDWI
jgi:hypothetical protein